MDELASSSSKVSVASTRVRDKTATLERLQSSLLRVMDSGRRLSIKAVAEEAGVTPSLIHHVYPDVAEQIRATMGRSTRAQRDAKHDELVDAKRTISDQKAELRELRADLASIASVNLQLQDRIDELEAQLEGKLAPIRI
ncbi:TetR family transcriptional regulator [Massilia sp. DD77]|uniref:TetR family transcriptional regulator n=1 Tax=Massilia sp. DD77 TaxID=3109349 RepID=UPI00300023DF